MPCVRLPAVDNDPHELVVLRDGDLLPGRPPGGALGSAFSSLSAAVLTGHPGDGVRLHVQHPGELKEMIVNKNQSTFSPTAKDLCASLYPNLFVIFDGASAFPVEAEAHQVNTENAGEGFDARPLHSGSLRGETNVHDTINTYTQPAGTKTRRV